MSDLIMRKCSKCGLDKELNKKNFNYDSRRLHRGIFSYFRKECRDCFSLNLKQYNSRVRERKEYNKLYSKKIIKDLSDRYIIKLIKDKDKTLKFSDIRKNKELIELYRLRLMLKRELKNDTTT